jgi:hypothetical protein
MSRRTWPCCPTAGVTRLFNATRYFTLLAIVQVAFAATGVSVPLTRSVAWSVVRTR